MHSTDNVCRETIEPLSITNPINVVKTLNPPTRLLCGPGPGNAHPRVHTAMALPQVGHMDPEFLSVCEDVKSLLRYVWQTNNKFTIPVSGTGSAAWEAAVANLTSTGDVHLVFVNGYFGERHCDMASRYGANIKRVEAKWGDVFTLEEIVQAIKLHQPQIVWICSAETSTGAMQPLEGIGKVCREIGGETDCLLLVDTVTAIGGVPLQIDKLCIDAAYAGAQKCLSCPPGISPLTFGNRALAKMSKRIEKGEKVANWYLDLNMIRKYLFEDGGGPRVYHHTAPISMIFGLREALTVIADEGLENVWRRHDDTARYFWKLVEEMGLEMYIEDEKCRLPSLHTVKVPDGIDAAAVIKYLRTEHRIEIGGGLGEQMAGKVWRIGLMGYNSRKEVALLVVSALKEALKQQNLTCSL